jgi:undecaprenyl-diphosphatase
VRYLQPLALSTTTRKAVHAQDQLLTRTRAAAALASGAPGDELARLERVRPRTLLMIAVLAGAFYFLLPQIAQVSNAWKAFQSANFGWLPLIILLSGVTYIGAAIGIKGAVPTHVRLGPAVLVQGASSFVNRVTPASIGGMVLNARFLETSGADRPSSIAAVGLNSLVGGIVHVVLIVVFFVWSGSEIGRAFKLPSTSKLLLVVPVVLGALGAVLLTRWGRRKVLTPLVNGIRSAITNLREVGRSPVKLALLFGGSTIVTLAYILAMYVSVRAFNGNLGLAKAGAVYLGASAVASAAPTPGNLGALEAALVAGLTGVGVSGGIAVSSVLTYRVATYWLPVIPGWFCWWLIQRREYV